MNLHDNSARKFLAAGSLLSLREANRPPLDTNIRTIDSGGDALLVQLLAGLGCHSWSSGSSGDEYAHVGDDVYRS